MGMGFIREAVCQVRKVHFNLTKPFDLALDQWWGSSCRSRARERPDCAEMQELHELIHFFPSVVRTFQPFFLLLEPVST